jgi:RNase P subunit RPR2
MFQSMIDKMPGTKIDIGRKITFYCNACRGIIGTKTIPLRVEPFRPYDSKTCMETEVAINVEMYRCLACGHHTRYSIQDPILSVY